MKVEVTAKAEKQLKKLPSPIRLRIVRKINFYANQADIYGQAVSLQNKPGLYRWRAGVYRIIFRVEGGTVYILTVGHRKDIYDK